MTDESPYWTLLELTKRFKKSKSTLMKWMALEENPLPRATINQRGIGSLWSKVEIEKWESGFSGE